MFIMPEVPVTSEQCALHTEDVNVFEKSTSEVSHAKCPQIDFDHLVDCDDSYNSLDTTVNTTELHNLISSLEKKLCESSSGNSFQE